MTPAKTTLYAPLSLTVDIVVFTVEDAELKVLLIERADSPYKGMWALPGSFLRKGETTEQAALRTLKEKAGITDTYVEQLYTFDDPRRDPRGRVISTSYVALVNRDHVKIRESTTTQQPTLHAIRSLPKLAFDHKKIISYAHERLRYKLEYTNIVYALLPRQFPFIALQEVYEVILGKHMDKRNFRKKFSSLALIRSTHARLTGAKQRPAKLYEFKSRKPIILKRFF